MHDVLVLFMFLLMADLIRVGSKLCYRQILRGVFSKPCLLPFLVQSKEVRVKKLFYVQFSVSIPTQQI